MIAGFLAVLHGGFIVGACDHSSVAEDAHFHVAQRGGGCVGGLDLNGSLSLGLALAVRGDGDPYARSKIPNAVSFVVNTPSRSPHAGRPVHR
jgi:hypothetical protein